MSNYSHQRALLILFALIAISVYSVPNNASALTLTPVRFEVSGDPGEIIKEEMLLINETDVAEAYYSSYSNFEAQGETGDPAFVLPEDGLGTWITTGISSIFLAPREQKIIPFEITIPEDAEPGGHFAVIFWGTSPVSRGDNVSVGSQSGILVLLTVNGDVRQDAGLLDFNTKDRQFWYQTLPVAMEYRIKNDGGDRIKPLGKVTIRNTVFLPTEKIDANFVDGNVLPASTRKFNVKWQNYEHPEDYVPPTGTFGKFWGNVGYQWKNFAVGLYSAKLDITYGQDTGVKDTIYMFVFPWQLVLVMLIVLAIVFWGGRWGLNRYNRYIIERARSGMTQSPPPSFSNE